MSPPALAARVVLNECIKELVNKGNWIGARLIEKS
jgi:LysR family tcuABC transcriptional regulator